MALGLTNAQKTEVIDRTLDYLDLARSAFSEKLTKKSLPDIPIRFDLIGKTAGMYKVARDSKEIRYNPYIFGRYYQDNLKNTVPHEVAHYVIDNLYRKGQVRPHGREWKSIMTLFGAKPDRTFDYDLSGLPQRYHQTLPYQCACREHNLSMRRHNQVIRYAKTYYCKQCKTALMQIPVE